MWSVPLKRRQSELIDDTSWKLNQSFSPPTGAELEDPTVGVVVQSRLGRSVPGAAADLGRSVQVSPADHLDVERLDAVRTGRFSDLIGRLLELDGGS